MVLRSQRQDRRRNFYLKRHTWSLLKRNENLDKLWRESLSGRNVARQNYLVKSRRNVFRILILNLEALNLESGKKASWRRNRYTGSKCVQIWKERLIKYSMGAEEDNKSVWCSNRNFNKRVKMAVERDINQLVDIFAE